MMFLGTFLSGDELSLSFTPTDIGDINSITIGHGIFDDLYATTNITDDLTGTIPSDWTQDTILHASYDRNLNAGNVDWTLGEVDELVIKRCRISDLGEGEKKEWITLFVKPVTTMDDFNVSGQDITAGQSTYEYAVIPVHDGIEGVYSIAKTYIDDKTVVDNTPVEVSELTIVDRNAIHHTMIANSISETSNQATTSITTLFDKYPTIIRNGKFNYENISITATFLPKENNDCDYIYDDDLKMSAFNRNIKAWLTSPTTKLVKDPDGNMWLAYLDSGMTDNPKDDLPNIRELSFSMTEVGNPENEKDLWEAGLLDDSVTTRWWNTSVQNSYSASTLPDGR